MGKKYYVIGIIIIVLLIIGYFVLQNPSSHSYKTFTVSNISDIPQSYNDCVKNKSYSNDLVCYYDFIIHNNDELLNFCEANGGVLPPSPPDPSSCRLVYYNPKSTIPKDFDECVKIVQNSYRLTESYKGPYSECCRLGINREGSMTPEIQKSLFTQCSNNPNANQNYLSHGSCFIEFFK